MKPLALVLLCLAVAGCAPAYIEDLDRAAGLTRRMSTVGTVGPLGSLVGIDQARVKFLPVKPTVTTIDALDVRSGFTVIESSGSVYLQFASPDPSGHVQLTSPAWVFGLAGADPNYPLYEFDVTSTTATGNIVVLKMFPTGPGSSTANLYSVSLPAGPFMANGGPQVLGNVFSLPFTSVLGVAMSPQPAASDSFSFLAWNGTTTFAEGSTTVTGGATVFAASSATGNPLLAIPSQRALYYKSPGGAFSYASYFTGGQWVCVRWQTSQASVPLGSVTHRIDALLTSGDLLSTEGGVLRLYDPNGTQVMSVSLGGLRYCYECYVGPTPYVFFSLTMNLGRGGVAFRVYAVPTSSMRGLGG